MKTSRRGGLPLQGLGSKFVKDFMSMYILLRRKGQVFGFNSTGNAWPLSREDSVSQVLDAVFMADSLTAELAIGEKLSDAILGSSEDVERQSWRQNPVAHPKAPA